jgi:hypothetical protein
MRTASYVNALDKLESALVVVAFAGIVVLIADRLFAIVDPNVIEPTTPGALA